VYRAAALIGLAGLTVCLAACPRSPEGRQAPGAVVTSPSIEAVHRAHTDALMAIPGVVGTAVGRCDDAPCIKVYVAERTPEVERWTSRQLDGYAVEIEVTGEFRALSEENGKR
jgi:hypothetical protein